MEANSRPAPAARRRDKASLKLDLPMCTHLVAAMLALAVSTSVGAPEDNTYVDPDHGFSIRFPVAWRVEPGLLSSTIAKALFREGRDTATILVSYIKDGLGVKSLTAREIYDRIAANRPDLTLQWHGGGVESIGLRCAKWLSYTTETTPPRYVLAFLFPDDDSLYSITCTTHPRNRLRYETTFHEVAASFRILAQDHGEQEQSSEPVRFESKELALSLELPGGWKIKPAPTEDVVLFAVSGATRGRVKGNFHISILSTPKGTRLNSVAPDVQSLVETAVGTGGIGRLAIIRTGTDTVAGRLSLWAEYSFNTSLNSNRAISYFLEQRGRVIHMQAILDVSNRDADLAQFMDILSTVRLGDTPRPASTRAAPRVLWGGLLALAGAVALAGLLVAVRKRKTSFLSNTRESGVSVGDNNPPERVTANRSSQPSTQATPEPPASQSTRD